MNKSTFTRKELDIFKASEHWEDAYKRIMAIRRRRTALYAIAYGIVTASLWIACINYCIDKLA